MGEGGRRGFGLDNDMREPQEAKSPTRKKLSGAPPRRRAPVQKNRAVKLPADIVKKLGVRPGGKLEIIEERGRVEIRPNIHSLARVYIEPTSRCNLSCKTCIRNTWTEPLGDMSPETFDKIVVQLRRFDHLESVMFGGFGEPTAHSGILEMIGKAHTLGIRVEMTTNGTLLNEAMLEGLFKNRLDVLWVSFDGTESESYQSIRDGASFQRVVSSLRALQKMNARSRHKIRVGISFVVLKRNISDLKNMDELARAVGADKVLVSNVLPYSEEMEKEMLCLLTLSMDTFTFASPKTEISLPRLDVTPFTRDTLFRLLQGYENLTLMGNKIFAETRSCRFIRDRTTFIRWDGKVSPCMGLLHSYQTYLYGNERKIRSYTLGDISQRTLYEIWNSREYRKFRDKMREFDFSPCYVCGGCTLFETNDEDCFGNAFPACGGCLWAQGVIQCP